MSDYDVIVIGSGAGGGTLVAPPRPSGKRILLLERGDWLPREPENWDAARRLRRQPLHLAGHLVRRERQAVPAAGPLLRRRRDEALRRRALPPARRGLRRAARTTTASRPPGRSATTRWSRTTRRPSSSTRCTARAARTRPSRRRARPTRSRPSSHEPRIQQLSDDLAAAGYHPFHAPCGVMLDEANMPFSALRALRHLRRLPVPRARQVRRRGARRAAGARAPERHAADERRGAAAGDERGGHGRHRGRRRARRCTRDVRGRHRRRLLRRGEHRPSCCSRRRTTSTPTAWPTARTRSAATTCSTTARPCSRCRRSRTRPSSRRRSGSTTSTSAADDFDFPLGQHPDGRQVAGADVPRREAAARRSSRPEWTLEQVARHAVDFWLSTEDLPRPENRVTLDRDGSVPLALHAHQRACRSSGSTHKLKSMLGQLGMHPDHLITASRLPEERDPGRGRRAPGGHLPLRAPTPRRRCSTATAGRTSSTTSTSSTRASSRASARSTRR